MVKVWPVSYVTCLTRYLPLGNWILYRNTTLFRDFPTLQDSSLPLYIRTNIADPTSIIPVRLTNITIVTPCGTIGGGGICDPTLGPVVCVNGKGCTTSGPGFALVPVNPIHDLSQISTFDLLQASKTIQVTDANVCAADWCPWSNSCTEDVKGPVTYCSQLDEQGHPRITSDVNCATWCKTQSPPYEGSCGQAAVAFCQNYPNHPACFCQTFTSSDEYLAMKKVFSTIPGCYTCSLDPDPVCWAKPCLNNCQVDPTNLDCALLSSAAYHNYSQCSNTDLNICQQIVDVQNVTGNVNISGNTFYQACNIELPNGNSPSATNTPSPSSSITPSPSPDPSDTPSTSIVSFFSHHQEMIVVFVVLCFIIIIVFYYINRYQTNTQ